MFDEDLEYLNSYYVDGSGDYNLSESEETLYDEAGRELDADTWFARF